LASPETLASLKELQRYTETRDRNKGCATGNAQAHIDNRSVKLDYPGLTKRTKRRGKTKPQIEGGSPDRIRKAVYMESFYADAPGSEKP
jgi:hypothetical protein